MVEQVREMVVRESPTHDKPACDALCDYLARQFEALGGRVKIHRQANAGNHLQVDFAGPEGRKPVLLLGHYDTVYDLGTLEDHAVARGQRRLYGPGVFDMKSGIAQMMFAIARPAGGQRRPAAAGHSVAGLGRRGRQRQLARPDREDGRASARRCWCASRPGPVAR